MMTRLRQPAQRSPTFSTLRRRARHLIWFKLKVVKPVMRCNDSPLQFLFVSTIAMEPSHVLGAQAARPEAKELHNETAAILPVPEVGIEDDALERLTPDEHIQGCKSAILRVSDLLLLKS